MADYEQRVHNHLRLAEESSDSFKQVQANTEFKEWVWMSVTIFIARAVCNALLEIARAIREK